VKRTLLFVTSLTAILLGAVLCNTRLAGAQQEHQPDQHRHDSSEKLGRVDFAVSCSPPAQRQFNRAVAWLHSFEYEEAEKAFTEVTVTDPRCGMGYWGVAMSNYHSIWAPPTPAELQKGASAIAKAKVVGAGTARERDYIAAIEVFYNNYDKLDHRTRTFAYSDAMKQLYQCHPSDNEAGVFYALTLIATGMMANDKNFAREKQAAQILNRVLAREPQHPGVTHYLIHSYDHSELAHLALPAARSYAKIAPASAHARHMPSHIFTRLGLWQEDIQSNLDAEAAAKAFAVRNHLSGAWDEQFHAMDYLAYAYLQGAQDKRAWGVLDELSKIQKAEPETFKVAYAATAIPARYALERRRWDEAAKLPLPQDDTGIAATGTAGVSPAVSYWSTFPWQRFRWAEANIHFARAIGAARSGDTTAARYDVEKLAAIQQALVETQAKAKGDYDWARQVDIQRLVASAWLAHAEGKHEESLRLMRAAADIDDSTEKHPVTPGAILPAREQLGELLLELKQPTAALQEFETSLRSAPNRFNGLYGAARAARLASDQNKLAADQNKLAANSNTYAADGARRSIYYRMLARSYYSKLLVLCRLADTIRPERDEAKAFVLSKTSARLRGRNALRSRALKS
jgi:tetratricopeptide (TPR) repeat protein